MAATNGAISERLLSARHSQNASAAVAAGAGDRNAMLGQVNQRRAISSSMNGVHRLTMRQATTQANCSRDRIRASRSTRAHSP